jgi:IS30 family transposase
VSLVERLTGVVLIGKVPNLSAAALNQRLLRMIRSFKQAHGLSFETITADNGTEFHWPYVGTESCPAAPIIAARRSTSALISVRVFMVVRTRQGQDT